MTDSRPRLGIVLWAQGASWQELRQAGLLVDHLGYDSLWTWDHLEPVFGRRDGPILEGPSVLAAWAVLTQRVRLGLFVAGNTFRNPALLAKSTVTLDHLSGGRAILGIGGAWLAREHVAAGVPFGSGFGERLAWLDESVGALRVLLDGGSVSSATGSHYAFADLMQRPGPIQERLPILVGGSGEQRTLRTVARYADAWNAFGDPGTLAGKDLVLRRHCAEVGRDPASIERTVGVMLVIRDTEDEARRVWRERLAGQGAAYEEGPEVWLGSPRQIVARVAAMRAIGFHTIIAEVPPPFDVETIERFIGEVGAGA
jgi:alkanesulfonate monooxygenase SsuD/methylene tetrahydromethanopterin reductase-like flavin-dependent oxidoreductase (luciferase family)